MYVPCVGRVKLSPHIAGVEQTLSPGLCSNLNGATTKYVLCQNVPPNLSFLNGLDLHKKATGKRAPWCKEGGCIGDRPLTPRHGRNCGRRVGVGEKWQGRGGGEDEANETAIGTTKVGTEGGNSKRAWNAGEEVYE